MASVQSPMAATDAALGGYEVVSVTPTIRAILLVVLSSAISSVGQTLLKVGLEASRSGEQGSPLGFLRAAFGAWQVWLGLALFASSVLLWMRVLSTTELSWGYPLLGLSYVFVALAGWLVFGEQLGGGRLLGIALVIAGAVLIGRS